MKTLGSFDHLNLIPGKHYFVIHENSKRKVRRIFKKTELRFGNIICAVFTSKIPPQLTMEVLPDGYVYRNGKMPSSELSIPYYDLLTCEPIKKATE